MFAVVKLSLLKDDNENNNHNTNFFQQQLCPVLQYPINTAWRWLHFMVVCLNQMWSDFVCFDCSYDNSVHIFFALTSAVIIRKQK